jgi:uncharacterized protein (DUF1778 family)
MAPKKAHKREDEVRVRVSAQEKRLLQRAAASATLEVSTWLRAVGIAAAREILKDRER